MRAALEQALEALRYHRDQTRPIDRTDAAIAAAEAALADVPEADFGEPVTLLAAVRRLVAGFEHVSEIARQWEPDHSSGAERAKWARATEACADVVRLLSAPAAPARQPLTDEQIDALPWGPHEGNPVTFAEGLRDFARAIERAHGITGDAA